MSRINLRTWLEIDSRALKNNISQFRKILKRKTQLMAVVKSNAYGHGLIDFSKLCQNWGVDWLGVDSLIEGINLRKAGLKLPILVLGYTLPNLFREAAKHNISITISSWESLQQIADLQGYWAKEDGIIRRIRRRNFLRNSAQNLADSALLPKIHIKIDTGMHRQGFLPGDVPRVVKVLRQNNIGPEGVYTHFASAKDKTYPFITINQFQKFQKAVAVFEKAGFKNLIKHCAATGATILYPETHLDLVRLGIGLYGLYPSREIEIQRSLPQPLFSLAAPKRGLGRGEKNRLNLQPVLSWKSIVSEIKVVSKGSYISYDWTERVSRQTRLAIVPIGYWHGFARALSGIGQVLIRGRRAKVLGRVTMDIIIVDATDIPKIKVGDEVTLLGRSGREEITADEIAQKLGTINYEVVTRINPLIQRIVRQ